MAESYRRNCRHCGEPIRMAQMENGQWLPFDLSGGRHTCGGGATATAAAVFTSAVTAAPSAPVGPNFNRVPDAFRGTSIPDRGILPRWLWIVLAILILIVLFLNWVASWWPW